MATTTSSTSPRDLALTQTADEPDGFVLDITLLEIADPAGLVNMTDDNCGSTCQKTTCISAV
ncbi:FxLD family lantipeptide [Streptomyces sp. NA02950]|uniref:FxLD family lanthipeptide n=1 Tax=Streptomyces sp. NA02950 TaxID=2742137 RepID=UPI001590C1A3|nr:FxLD family lanthipeptide [Streptomyces sp. NA02950]QKV90420.1 FxLD family lantipeptide [Streptomyces sp. NA02950]QKV97247.1 FxLD family lantipeptide [Streptomyces sp. NA02950]